MQLEEATELARDLMDEHGLDGWSFGFDGARRRLGACWLQRQRISLSREFVRLNDPEIVRDVLLHEIAHALTPGDGHGPRFKQKARELGCEPRSCVDSRRVRSAPARYLLVCPHCGATWRRYRKPASGLACGKCLRTRRPGVQPLQLQVADD